MNISSIVNTNILSNANLSATNMLRLGSNAVLNTPIPPAALLSLIKMRYDQLGPVFLGPGAVENDFPFKLPILDEDQKSALEKAKKFAIEQSIKAALEKQSLQKHLNPSYIAKRAQTLSLLNRIYVGSISYDLREDAIKKVFSPFGLVRSVNLSWDSLNLKHKGFAFVEFEHPEAAFLASQSTNSISLGGRQLKVGRPSNLLNADSLIEDLIKENGLEKKIYVSGVHKDLNEDDVSLVFEAFGKISLCKLNPDPSKLQKHLGFGFIEYESVQSAIDAIANMNMFDLGGQYLRVCKAISPPEEINIVSKIPSAAALAAASVTAKLNAMEAENSRNKATPSTNPSEKLNTHGTQDISEVSDSFTTKAKDDDEFALDSQDDLFIKGKEARKVMMQKLSRVPQNVMLLRNMVEPGECDEDLELEVTEECSSYGSVEKVSIHQERSKTGEFTVKIFVVFSDLESTNRAITALNGRYFAGRKVHAELYDIEKFISNDFTG
uniref:RRM domain-containing protein n=1 Tax=Trichobilharzia regenti TaxID=157069 RepID=A0AA85JTE4_TRIRE|nr:unnamed protein product [Trichobilharzia regenti]